MWLFTKCGFFSIVKKTDGFHIRARKRGDLEALREEFRQDRDFVLPPIAETNGNDYAYRIVISSETLLPLIFNNLARSIDYSNFKSKISATPDQRDKLPALHNIWEIMANYQETQRRAQTPFVQIDTEPLSQNAITCLKFGHDFNFGKCESQMSRKKVDFTKLLDFSEWTLSDMSLVKVLNQDELEEMEDLLTNAPGELSQVDHVNMAVTYKTMLIQNQKEVVSNV